MTPQELRRRNLAELFAPDLAERLYQIDKGNRYARLSNLPEAARQIYLTAAKMILECEFTQLARMTAVQAAIAQEHALRDDDNESVQRQARQDIAKYPEISKRTH